MDAMSVCNCYGTQTDEYRQKENQLLLMPMPIYDLLKEVIHFVSHFSPPFRK